MITIKDISRECSVSPATVSKALNGYTDISEETRELVLETARRLHYVPNKAAQLLKTKQSHSIGVLFVDKTMSGLTHEYFSAVLDGTRAEAEKLGYDLTFIGKTDEPGAFSYVEHCRYRGIDGVVIASVDFNDPAVRELALSEIPVVTIDHQYEGISCVMSDNEEGPYELVRYLAGLGHKRIAFIHGEQTLVTEKRIEGYRKAMEDFHCEFREEYLVEGRYHDPERSGRATRALMALKERPTAILFSDDYSYLGGATELEKEGLSIPEDISAVGYDGIYLSTVLRPKLTTWFQDAKAIGQESAKRLVDEIEHPDTCSKEPIKVSGKLREGYTAKGK